MYPQGHNGITTQAYPTNSILSYFILPSRHCIVRERERETTTMMLTAPDCFSASGALSLSSRDKSPRFFGRFNLNIGKTTATRTFRCCKASLIMNPESFEVGRLVGSYGFMNVTRCSISFPNYSCFSYVLFCPQFDLRNLSQMVSA